jgi:hypothetical protein
MKLVRCDKGKEEKGDKTSWNIKTNRADSCGMVHEKEIENVRGREKNRSRSVNPDHPERRRFT